MNQAPAKESVRYATLPCLGGVELLAANYVSQRFGRHFHEGYALGCIERGALKFHSRGVSFTAGPGQINLTVPGEVHDGQAALPEGWAYRMFYLDPAALAAACDTPEHSTSFQFRTAVLDDPLLAARIVLAHRVALAPTTTRLAKQTLVLELIAAWLQRHAIDRPALRTAAAAPKAVALARDYIASRYEEDISLDDLSRAAALSPFHLIRVFEKQNGLTPHAFLIQTRLAAAKQLLEGTNRVADIAAQTGFADQAHLTRLFKLRYGLTPAAFRNFLQNS